MEMLPSIFYIKGNIVCERIMVFEFSTFKKLPRRQMTGG